MKRPATKRAVKSAADPWEGVTLPRTHPARRLRDCAENAGMTVRDVCECPRILQAAGIAPASITPGTISEAVRCAHEIQAELQRRVDAWNAAVVARMEARHAAYKCEPCGATVPAGTPQIKYAARRDGKIVREVPCCQRCADWLACQAGVSPDGEALLAELRAKRATERKPAAPKIVLPPPAAPSTAPVDL